jgi:hypothetical protein
MPTVTLLTKIYNNMQTRQIDRILRPKLEGLKVEARILETTANGWIQIAFSGEDENITANYLASEFGFCPIDLEHVERFATAKGYVIANEEKAEELCVDIGVFSPKIVYATIPLSHLQTQLVDGRKIALEKIAELFAICDNLPLTVKMLSVNMDKERIEAIMSERQLDRYENWRKSLLDRLIILGSSSYEVELVLDKADLRRDVIDVEPLGLFEHALVCKLETDAAGLIPRIGKMLRYSKFAVFNPKKILEF